MFSILATLLQLLTKELAEGVVLYDFFGIFMSSEEFLLEYVGIPFSHPCEKNNEEQYTKPISYYYIYEKKTLP